MTSRAIVLGSSSINSLGLVRALGKEGLEVDLYNLDNGRYPISEHSSYVNISNSFPSEENLLEKLLNDGRNQKDKGVIFVSGDNYLLFCERNKEKLNEYYYLPESRRNETLEDLLDKQINLELGQSSGFNVPASEYITKDFSGLEGKLLVKPINSEGTSKEDIFIYQNAEELLNKREHLIEKYGEMVVQQYIEGGVEDHYEIHGILINGKPYISTMIQKITALDNSTKGSIGSIIKTVWEDEFVEPTYNLLRALDFNGPIDINIKRDANTGKFYFLEANLRSSANISLDTNFGLNLPYLSYLNSLGHDIPLDYLKHEFNEGYWVAEHRIVGDVESIKLKDNLQSEKKEICYAFYDENDIKPYYIAMDLINKGVILPENVRR